MAGVIRGKALCKTPFDKRLCTCGHPAGIHGDEGCWSYGLIEAKCRKHCKGFRLDNLKYLAGKYDERHKRNKK